MGRERPSWHGTRPVPETVLPEMVALTARFGPASKATGQDDPPGLPDRSSDTAGRSGFGGPDRRPVNPSDSHQSR
ncbi:hypothetical protein FRAHR75_610028 [Frankia sp. Hr75.2]|nr:hypothetical protein FRAHR75_610028 [Frankia sp. Hr75.2]SQD97446.1 hypothetical protein FMEAI12_4110021 [Parafrankia sp. Ea1.12]